MHEEFQSPRPNDLPSTPSSVDPVSTDSTTNQPLTNVGIEAILPEHVGSFDIGEMPTLERDEERNHEFSTRRVRSTSPLRANVKRKRSVASAPGDVSGEQLSRRNSLAVPSDGNDVKAQSKETIALGKEELTQGHPTKQSASHANDAKARKRKKRNGKTQPPDKTDIEKFEVVKESPEVTESPGLPIIPPLSLYGGVDDGVEDDEPKYERKGAFWLKKDKGPEEFRFPKPPSHPEPLWCPGDGFSVDEVRSNFAFRMTGSQKQRKPKSTPGVGELQLETHDGDEKDPRMLAGIRRKHQRLLQYELKHHRRIPKDVWPTVDNFSEELEVQKRNPAVPASEKIIPSTVPPQPTPVPQLRETFSYNLPLMPRQRGNGDFENFGRHLGNGDEISNTYIPETQIDLADHTVPSEFVGDESFGRAEDEEYEVEGEEKDGNESVVLSWHEEAPDGNGEYELTSEKVTSSDICDEESSIRYSAIPDDVGPFSQEMEYSGDILNAGDVASEAFDFS
ncbi:hypothetical protein F5Y02DRAFT_413257 [Annulohypoxylon stygium]|nr:hypothetical protein F5Y02DRAFT_413257 [Annulohypoxylon stygium]